VGEIDKIIIALKNARKAQGLSQVELSERVGVPQSHISKIENGNVDIQLSSLTQLARALDFELQLVPKKALPAVQSIVRSTELKISGSILADAAKLGSERMLASIAKLRSGNILADAAKLSSRDRLADAVKQSSRNRLADAVNSLDHFKLQKKQITVPRPAYTLDDEDE